VFQNKDVNASLAQTLLTITTRCHCYTKHTQCYRLAERSLPSFVYEKEVSRGVCERMKASSFDL